MKKLRLKWKMMMIKKRRSRKSVIKVSLKMIGIMEKGFIRGVMEGNMMERF